MATVTVIIPVFNRASVIERTLSSVATQRRLPDRLIVVDNGSTDGSRNTVERWIAAHPDEAKRMRTAIMEEKTPGACAARNRGLQMADTEWVMFFDSDDEMLPLHIQRAMDIAARNPEASIVGWDVSVQLPDGSRRKGRFQTYDMMAANLVHGIMATQRYMARTSLFRKAGEWNPTVMKWNDWELGIRLLADTPKAVKAEGENTVIMNFTKDSITGTKASPSASEHALEVAEEDLRATGQETYLPWITYRRAVLAAQCRRDGLCAEALDILKKATQGMPLRLRLATRLTYLHALILGRGAHFTFRILAPV